MWFEVFFFQIRLVFRDEVLELIANVIIVAATNIHREVEETSLFQKVTLFASFSGLGQKVLIEKFVCCKFATSREPRLVH
jgi:hypothetical protein